jgi:ABC-type transport system substrate-binding protein
MKRVIVYVLAIMMVVFMFGCQAGTETTSTESSTQTTTGSEEAATETEATGEAAETTSMAGGILTYRIQGEPTTLQAWSTRNPIDTTILNITNETLLRYDSNGDPQPFLVDSITADKAALTFTLKIKQGIKFHDGSDLTAEVVAWNLNYYKENGVLTGSFYGSFDNAEVMDEETVVIHMNVWDSLFPSALARTCYITSKVAFDTYGADYLVSNPVGTGSFMFESWDHDEAVHLVKFADYWQGEPLLDGVDMVIYTDETVAAAALQQGELDVLPVTDYNTATQLAGNDDVVVQAANLAGTGYTLCYMCTNAEDPLSDIRVRQAFSYAIDTSVIGPVATQGYYIESSQWCAPGTAYYNDQIDGYGYDVEKAKELLAEAGYADGFTTRITLQTGWGEDQAQIIAQQLAAIGVTCELNVVEVANYAGYIGSWEYGMLLHPMGTSNGQASQLAANFKQGLERGLGVTAFLHTDEVNDLITEAIAADADESIELFKEIAYKVFMEECMMETTVLTQPVVAYTSALHDSGLYASMNRADTLHLAWLDS